MQTNINGTRYKKLYIRKKPTDEYVMYKRAFVDGVPVYSAGNPVTYIVDSEATYTEEVDYDASVLSPKTFTPEKAGWEFVGWREDTTASDAVLTNKVMGDNPITLYAVFSQDITVTYFNNSSNASTSVKKRYYNNGKTADPSFTLSQASVSGWTANGWSTGKDGNASTTYGNNTAFTRMSDITLYGKYKKTIKATFISGTNKSSSKDVTGTAYRNYTGTVINASITAPTGAGAEWTWRGWSAADNTAADAAVAYANGATVSLSSDATFYGLHQYTFTLTYNGNGATSGSTDSQTGTAFYNSCHAYKYPKITLRSNGYSRTDHSFTGWNIGAAGASYELTGNTTAYAQWSRMPATAFYLYSQNPSYSRTAANGSISGYDPSSSQPYWYVYITHNGGTAASYGSSTASAINRQHCTKCKFTAHIADAGDARIVIGGRSHTISIGENVIDISDLPETIQIALHSGSMGANHGVQITAPYFY